MIDFDNLLLEGATQASVNRAKKLIKHLKYSEGLDAELSEDGLVLMREEGDDFWEIEFINTGEIGIGIDFVVRSDSRARRVLRALGEVL